MKALTKFSELQFQFKLERKVFKRKVARFSASNVTKLFGYFSLEEVFCQKKFSLQKSSWQTAKGCSCSGWYLVVLSVNLDLKSNVSKQFFEEFLIYRSLGNQPGLAGW